MYVAFRLSFGVFFVASLTLFFFSFLDLALFSAWGVAFWFLGSFYCSSCCFLSCGFLWPWALLYAWLAWFIPLTICLVFCGFSCAFGAYASSVCPLCLPPFILTFFASFRYLLYLSDSQGP
eukprot:UN4651